MLDYTWSALASYGIRAQHECAGGEKEGLCWVPTSQDPYTSLRSHSGKGHYVEVIKNRKNYDLLVKHKVRRLQSSSMQTTGAPLVEVTDLTSGANFSMKANLEVILSAGALNTPLILQRSGIGPADLLKEAKIELVSELPGVGYNFHDHGGPFFAFTSKSNMEVIQKETFLRIV
jgi:choline dehydrogenase